MTRPLGIEYPGAWYHAMNRGRRSEQIFNDKTDCQAFIDLLLEASEMWQFLLRILRCHRLKEIGQLLQIENYSSVSSVIERMKIQMQNDRKLKNRIDKVTENIAKSQRQT